MKVVGVFCLIFCISRGKYPPCQIMWCGGFYKDNHEDDFPKSGKELVGYFKGVLEGRY